MTPEKSNNTQKTITEEPTIIPEKHPLPETQQHDEIFSSPTVATNNRYQLLQNIPDPEDITTPDTTLDNEHENLTTKTTKKTVDENSQNIKRKSLIPTAKRQMKAKKLTTLLHATNFCDVGNLNNATNGERVAMIALSMYHRLGLYDP